MTREQAWALLTQYNQDPFHLKHAETVEGVMRYFAESLGYGDEADSWGNVGLLGWIRARSTPWSAMATASAPMWHRSMRWKRCSLPSMSSPASLARQR